ncbi:4,5-DOPA dioxygenase extradiol [Deferrisoma palaeochoriense]
MNALVENDYARSLRAVGRALPRPRAVAVVSAHWMTRGTRISCQPRLRQVYDFYGFPPELYALRYRPPGAPAVARRALDLLRRADPGVSCDEGWGLDHAGWTVLLRLFPGADVPVFVISVDVEAPAHHHLALGRTLLPLRDEGVLILGSGNVVHNLGEADLEHMDAPPDPRGVAFDREVTRALEEGDAEALARYQDWGEAARFSVPTPDHYLPLLWVAALRTPEDRVTFPHEGFQNRSVSMRAVGVGSP